MLLTSHLVFLWKAQTLEEQSVAGILDASSKLKAKRQLQKEGYYNISLDQIPATITSLPLKVEVLLSFIHSLTLMLTAGMQLNEALEMIQLENRSVTQRFICYRLLESLEKGLSIKESFSNLSSLFPAFFIAVIEISEQSGQLLKGLQSASEFYQNKLNRERELKKITRYPKIVFIVSILLVATVIVFIIPMFQNIYQLFEGDLPVTTKLLVSLSEIVHNYPLSFIVASASCLLLFTVPILKSFNPVSILIRKIKRYLDSLDDPYIYALSMKMQLENGQPLTAATNNATHCISINNQQYGEAISKYLEAGFTLANAFFQSKWFPAIFQQMISTAEKAGRLSIGFEQIALFLDQKRSDRFTFWNKFLEPLMMILLGGLVLTILLAIYLPIFDLGNRIG